MEAGLDEAQMSDWPSALATGKTGPHEAFPCHTRRHSGAAYIAHLPDPYASFNEVPRRGEVVALVVGPQQQLGYFQVDRVLHDPSVAVTAVLYCTYDADQLPHSINP